MDLTVLNVAYPFAPVGLDTCGGAEQIVCLLDRALTRQGWRSIVVAREDSHVSGTLIGSPVPDGELSGNSRRQVWRQYRQIVEQAIQDHQPNVVHMHGVDFDSYLPLLDRPVLVTLHLPLSWYAPEIFNRGEPNLHLQCVSEAQRRTCPASHRPIAVIENGVDVEQFSSRHEKRNFVLGLGRICPEKGFHIALEAARKANIAMLLGGEVYPYPEHERYFREQILSRLRPCDKFLGAVGLTRKRRLLASARCVVIPSLVPETSSLVAMEALASGTPVAAFARGALSDVVEDGKTGFLVSDSREMAEAIAKVPKLSPDSCRHRAHERFPASRMLARYLDLYRQLATRARSTPSNQISRSASDAAPSHSMRSARQSDPLEVREIADVRGLSDLELAWRDLYERCPTATPFHSPEWLIPWWKHFGTGQLCALALHAGGTLVGIVPLMFHDHFSRPVRQVSWWGAGVGDYQGPLFDPAWSRRGSDATLKFLTECACCWKLADLRGLRADSPLLSAAASSSLRYKLHVDDVCPALQLPSSPEQLEASLGSQFRKNLRRARKHFENEGWSVTTASAKNSPDFLDVLFRLHGDRWREKGVPGVLNDSLVQTFHRCVSPGLIDKHCLRLQLLHRGEETAAAIYWTASKGRAYFYIGAFSPHYHRWSPGSVILWHAIQEAISLGCHELDFLRGAEPYKYSWGAKDRRLYRLVLRPV